MIKAIIEIMKEANEGSVTVERLDLFVKAILYGANPDGTVRILPVEPDPFDITRDPFKWKLDNRVWHSYIQSRNKKR